MLRPGELTDFDAIVSIHGSVAVDIARLDDPVYRSEIQRSGFLLPTALSEGAFTADVQNYTVAEDEGRVIGYLCLHANQSWEPEHTSVDWLRPELKDAYHADPHAYIHSVAVDPDAQKQGVASELLMDAERIARIQNTLWLFSMIVTSPITNVASMLFHEGHGFERLAQTRPARGAELDGFVNLLYGKHVD